MIRNFYNFIRCTLLLFVMCLSIAALGQKATITGLVTDDDGPLPGATIIEVGTTNGTTTDIDGNYTLEVEPGEVTIEVRFIGNESQQTQLNVAAGETVTTDFLMTQGVLLDDIVVTGTRSNPRTAISSVAPIDNFVAEVIGQQGNGDLTENLKNIVPSFTATPMTGDGAAFVRPTSLRGLPPDATLILVNSKRRHRSALIAHFGAAMNAGSHAVDIGHIPSIAVKNLEVLRDGAAAQYGSDAIAGVFNFILKDDNQGAEIQTTIGKWYGSKEGYGSETDYKVALNVGLPLTEKGFINLSGEYSFNEELKRGTQHEAALNLVGAPDPAMNWGRPESSGFRSFWNAGIEMAENVDLYSFGNYSNTYGNYSFFFRSPNRAGVLTPVPNDPQDPSKGNFSWGDFYPLGFTPRLEGFQTDVSSVTGIRGKLPAAISFDLSASFGFNRINYQLNNTLNPSWGPLSQRSFRPGDLQQFERNINADLSKEFTDDLNVAVGFQTRNETYTMYEGDPQSYVAGPWAEVGNLIDPETGENYATPAIGANGLAGTTFNDAGAFDGSSWGAYVDVEYDITKDILVQAAYRREDFRDFGATDNFKLAGRYKIADWLTIRGGYSTGFHAPTPGQANVVTITTSFDGVTGMQVQEGTVSPTDSLAVSLGGKDLVPETSQNISAGIASRISDNISLTVDFYDIKVDNRIIKSRALPIDNPLFKELAFYTNALNTRTSGLDVVASWKNKDTRISLAYNYNITDVLNQEQVNGVNPVSDAVILNLERNLPFHKANISINHDFGLISGMIRANYYSGTIDERGGGVLEDKEVVDPATLIDLEFTYPVSDKLRLVLGANNLLNTYPTEIETRKSQGMPYPRRTPIGYHGGMGYFKAMFQF